MLRATLCIVSSALVLSACAASPAARTVRAADMGTLGPLAPGQPLVIQFEPGDTIALHVAVEGALLRTDPDAAPLRVQVLRRFFLRIDGDSMRTSLDGRSFDEAPATRGSFSVGFGATKRGTEGRISIRTPTPSR
ncbi:MAG: hypothetical protein WKG00_33335 [Polyangiaceae bacterium]